MNLDIEGLPPDADLQLGRLYALALEENRYAMPLAYGAALNALAGQSPVWLVTEQEPAKALAGHGTPAATCREAVRSNLLKVFHGPTPPHELRRAGNSAAVRLREELVYFGVPSGALVIVDGADRYGIEDLGEWRIWAEQFDIALLLLMKRREDLRNPASLIQPQAAECGGFARIRGDAGGTLDIFHWFGSETVVTNRVFQLRQRDDGRLVAGQDDAPAGDLPPAVDEDAVLMLQPVLHADVSLPAGWQPLANLDALWTAVGQAVAVTVILGFGRDLPLNLLAQTVFRLRLERGARVKIVVREIEARLRYNQEALLTRLGANVVVPAEVAPARLFSLVSMIQGQTFQRRLPADFQEALTAAMPVMKQGYLPPLAFIDAVAAALDDSRALSIDCALLRLPLTHGLEPVDALRYCSLKRPGDLCTADDNNVYLFLFACRSTDVALASARLFQLPVDELFSTESRYMSAGSIIAALEELAPRAASCRDLGDVLSSQTPKPDAAAPDCQKPPGRRAPAPAVARPLPLRRLAAAPVRA